MPSLEIRISSRQFLSRIRSANTRISCDPTGVDQFLHSHKKALSRNQNPVLGAWFGNSMSTSPEARNL